LAQRDTLDVRRKKTTGPESPRPLEKAVLQKFDARKEIGTSIKRLRAG